MLRDLAIDRILSVMHFHPDKEKGTRRAIEYTLDLYEEVLREEEIDPFYHHLAHERRRLGVYVGPLTREAVERLSTVTSPFPGSVVLETEYPSRNRQGLNRAIKIADSARRSGGQLAFLQSPASGIPASLITRELRVGRLDFGDSEEVLITDLCGAPGNKTFDLIGELSLRKEARDVRAVINDISPRRLERVENRLEEQFDFTKQGHYKAVYTRQFSNGARAEVSLTCVDAGDRQAVERIVDQHLGEPPHIVVDDGDCPGDGMGTKNASFWVRWQPKSIGDVLSKVVILRNAISVVRPYPFGVVSYSNCSANPVIDEMVVDRVQKEIPTAKSLLLETDDRVTHPAVSEFRGLSFEDVYGVRTYQHRTQDAFFCALVVKDLAR